MKAAKRIRRTPVPAMRRAGTEARRTLLRSASLFVADELDCREGVNVLIEGNRIREVSDRPINARDARVIDLAGRVVLPGLIDAHVHVIGVTTDLRGLARLSPYLVAAQSKGVLESMLMRGFTTVRDAGGADWGLAEAIRHGHFIGPRLLVSGLALAPTGGQGDFRLRGEADLGCPVCRGARTLTRVADGVDDVRKAVRDELRNGANQIKVMASGGIASGVPIDRPQFSLAEIRAMVEEAELAGTYVMGHAYESRAIRRCLECGVRSIEHGNLIDVETSRLMAEKGAFLVPTISVYEGLHRCGKELGYPGTKIDAFARLLRDSIAGLDIARSAGVKIGHGSDLEGILHGFQSREFLLKAEAMSPHEVIVAATATNAELVNMRGEIGVVAEGALADLLVLDGNPLRDIGILSQPERHIRLIMKDGTIYKNEL